MPHAVSDGTVVEALECIKLLTELVSHSDEQETSLSAVDCDLTDDLIEALLEKRFPNGTDSYSSSFTLIQTFVKQLLQKNHIHRGRRHR